MVTSNAMNTNNTYVKYEISITQNSQSVNNNTSNVTVSVRFYRTNKGYKTWGSGTVYCKINGTTYTATVTPSQYITDSGIVLFSHTLNIPHNTDGSKTLTCSAWIEHNAPLTSSEQSFSVDLTTIPRKSSLSASDGTLGTEQTITVDRKSNNFTHTIMYQCGSTSGLICTKSTMTSLSFTPPLSLASENTTGTQVSVKLSIETFNGNTSIGTDSATISCTIPASVKPSCTIEVTDAAGCFDTYEAYVQSKSRFKVNVTGTTAYGSKIVSYSTTVDGNTYSGSVVTTNAVKSAGRIKITTTVKDARGRTGSTSVELDVLAYNAPSISLLNVHRCDADGTENAQGEYVVASFTALVTALNSKNSAQYVLEYKKSTDSIYTAVALSAYAGNYNPTNGTYLFEADTGRTYDVRLTASDDFETMVRNTSVSTGFAIMHWLASGLGMALGKIAEFADYLDVAWNARFRKNVEVDGHVYIGENLDFYSDTEGGNIRLVSPKGNAWEMDAFDESLRIYNDENYNPVKLTKDGDVEVGGKTTFYGGIKYIEIPNGTDLNTITTAGFYCCKTNASVGTLMNCPTTLAFSLEVLEHAGCRQRLTEYTPWGRPYIYERNYITGTWGVWENAKGGDFVVERGIAGGWVYRKWNSGLCECEGSFSYKFTSTPYVLSNVLYIYDVPVSMPSGVFNSPPTYCYGTCDIDAFLTYWQWQSTATSILIKVEAFGKYTTSNSTKINLTFKGTWK